MTASGLVQQLGRHGLPSSELEPKHQLFTAVLAAFRQATGGTPDHAWWIPGRLEVLGKHTDYGGGHSLICAVPRGFALVAHRRSDAKIRIHDAVRREELAWSGETFPPGEDAGRAGAAITGWRNYVLAVIRRLQRNFPGAAPGADIVLGSDLPSASGMSSSSALLTGVAAALARLADLPSRREWRANIRSAADEAGYYACIENGMTYGTLAGDAGVGTHGGSEDHVAILCAAPGELSAWRFVPIEHAGNARLPESWSFVIASSGVAAKKTGPARDLYNRLSREAAALLDLWRREDPAAPSLRAAMASGTDARDRLLTLVRQDADATFEAIRLERRLLQFVAEDARVLEALAACRAADARRIGSLAEASQLDAERLLENHVPETMALAQSARRLGAFAASSFGAGFGGSVWALVDRADAGTFAARWLEHYRAHFPHRTMASAFTALPGPPLLRLV